MFCSRINYKMNKYYYLFIIGGRNNIACIARDASGRGLSVYLAEKEEVR